MERKAGSVGSEAGEARRQSAHEAARMTHLDRRAAELARLDRRDFIRLGAATTAGLAGLAALPPAVREVLAEPAPLLRGARFPALLGQGYDTFSAEPTSKAVAGRQVKAGTTGEAGYTVCTSSEEVLETLEVNASAGASFGRTSVDAKTRYFNSLKVTSTSVVIAIRAFQTLSALELTSPRLTKPVPSRAGLNDFYGSYGDSYVSKLIKGREIIATYVFYSQSTEEQQQITASLEASHGAVSASVETAIQRAKQRTNTRTSFSARSFGFKSPLVMKSTGDLIEEVQKLTNSSENEIDPDDAVVVGFETTGYERVPQLRSRMAPIMKTRRLFTPTSDVDRNRGISGNVADLKALDAQAAWIAEVYKTYGYTGDTDLVTKRRQIGKDLATLQRLIDRIRNNPTRSYKATNLRSLSYGVPALEVSTPSSPAQWGEFGGDVFSDIDLQHIIDQTTIETVVLRGEGLLDQIRVTYTPKNRDSFTTVHGRDGGQDAAPLKLRGGEFITRLGIRAAKYVDRLEIRTSRNQERGIGGDGGDPYEWTVPPGSVVVGFAGRAARFVDRIGPLTCTFSPANWERQ